MMIRKNQNLRPVIIGTGMMQHATLDEKDVVPNSCEPRLREAGALVAEAAKRGCDFMGLPELFADPTHGLRMDQWAEIEGGPVTTWLARQAKKHRMVIVATVALRDSNTVANTGVIYDKRGRLVGCYPKVHLPDGEREIGTAGQDFPVFEVEGVRVGMQICYDLQFPEGCRILALRGAEVIFWPNMEGGMPEAQTEVVMRTRAIENGLYLVSSAYLLTGSGYFRVPKVHGRSCIIDWAGMIVAEVGLRLGVATALLDRRELQERRAQHPIRHGHRLPHLYTDLTGQPAAHLGAPVGSSVGCTLKKHLSEPDRRTPSSVRKNPEP